ncbi:MAG: class I SAM-dependent methyltransferase [Cyclobacteriaceae bacterium]
MFNTGLAENARRLLDRFRYNEIVYRPSHIERPKRLIESRSQAWLGLESIILDIITRAKIQTHSALEFGVEFGYSTAALANYFRQVTGVDIFTGDHHAGYFGDIYEETRQRLEHFENIRLVKSDYRDFIKAHDQQYDLIHVDIVHTYEDTFACGLWSAQHSQCTIFHDTQSFPEVKRAVSDIARITKRRFYNYRKYNGLGILFQE